MMIHESFNRFRYENVDCEVDRHILIIQNGHIKSVERLVWSWLFTVVPLRLHFLFWLTICTFKWIKMTARFIFSISFHAILLCKPIHIFSNSTNWLIFCIRNFRWQIGFKIEIHHFHSVWFCHLFYPGKSLEN